MLLMPWLVALTALACSPARDGEEAAFARAREEMVATQIAARGVRDPKTLAAMRKVARHLFVPPAVVAQAYEDHPLPIGHGQTISQPYIVGFMTEALGLRGGETVLEVGTGLRLPGGGAGRDRGARPHDRDRGAARRGGGRPPEALGYANVEVRAGDGYQGWPEAAPFDAIMVTAAAPRDPRAAQAAAEGRRAARSCPVGRRVAGARRRHPPRGPLRGEARAAGALRADDREGPAVAPWRRFAHRRGAWRRCRLRSGSASSCSRCRSSRSSRSRAPTAPLRELEETRSRLAAWARPAAAAVARTVEEPRPAEAAAGAARFRRPHPLLRTPPAAPPPPPPARAPAPARGRRSRPPPRPGPPPARTSPRTSARRSSSAPAASRSSSSSASSCATRGRTTGSARPAAC